ncbi:MAG TPA: S8 family serine peptidase, partial [Micromonosporaceae bacterium]|nr:S8 family serine peptidase [Micromonosporaceae bacterium]
APGTGAGVVIGVIDSGIWPESQSFARSMPAPPGWHGTCQTGAQFPASACNGKILGARYFATAWLANHGSLPEGEVLSPRDMRGHGTHVASTAAGLPVQNVMIDNRNFGTVTGVAPDAQIAVYKALWGGSGENDDIIAAIDAAVADGVGVLNLSAGNTFGDWEPNSPIGNAFLNAHLAGVAVTTSAGNDGISGAVSNTYPWVTTVSAAVTVANEATVRLGDGSRIVGTSLDALPDTSTRPLVYGFSASLDGSPSCDPGSLDAAKVRGKIVACDFINSGEAVAEVKAKGGAGVVLFQRFGNVRLNVIYGFPTVYLWSREQAGRLSTYLNRHQTGGTAALSTGGDGSSLPGLPTLANFSSYGPDQVHPGVQKPDVMAPGTDIVAAVAPPGNGGRTYDVYSGTSMAAPHVAGTAAILKGLHPTWSPGAIASALRTTATNTVASTTPHKQGSGFVDVNRANNPGLVVEASRDELTAFSQAATPDGRELNLPAIALRDYDGTRQVTLNRRFRNLGSATETYRATVSGLSGMRVTVSPSSFTVAPGATVSVTITLSRGTALFDRYVTGAITWSSSAHTVRLPVAARAWGFNPRAYDDESIQLGWTGQNRRGYPRPGFSGPVTMRTTGYTPVPWVNTSLQASYSTTLFDRNGDNVRSFPITVPSGAAGLLVQVEAPADNNLDLYLFKDGRQVEFSNADWHSNERTVLFQPGAGSYTAYVHAQRATTTTVNFRFGATVVPRGAQYNNADARLLDFLDNPVSTVTAGTGYIAEVTPRGTLPDVEHWSFVEMNTNGQLVPGPLISTR